MFCITRAVAGMFGAATADLVTAFKMGLLNFMRSFPGEPSHS